MHLTSIVLPVDRSRALMRALWRLVSGGLLLGGAWLVFGARDWALAWRTDPASFLSLGCVLLGLLVSGLLLCIVAMAWIALAASGSSVGGIVTCSGITLRLGPFG